jgi:Protein of unknown function (DUF2795)
VTGNRVSVDTRLAAEMQVLLEGVPLPAHKRELVEYARSQDGDAARHLESLPDREYRSLDEVGEALAPVQPPRSQREAAVPREESDLPPGGENYVKPHPEPGAVRHDAPPSNPPQNTLEKQSKAQNEQLERQQEKLG